MSIDKLLKSESNELIDFYKNEGINIFNDITNEYKENNIDKKKTIYLLKWCYKYYSRYFLDSVWKELYISDFINNNLDIFIPYETFNYYINYIKYINIIETNLFSKLMDILNEYYEDDEIVIHDTVIKDIEYKIIITEIILGKHKDLIEDTINKYNKDMFNFHIYCKNNFIRHIYLSYNYDSYFSDDINCPHFSLERCSCIEKSKSKKEFRIDLDKGFRSVWEANFARILDYYNIDYKYEDIHSRYKLKDKNDREINEKYKFVSMIYLPDFIVNNNIIEIKGEYDYRSLQNIALFKKLYPSDYNRLIIVDGDIYYMLKSKYKDIVNNWEEDNVQIMTYSIPVVGINLKDRKPYVMNLSIGDELLYEREIDNQYDKNAIKIMDINNHKIGYIASEYSNYYAPKIDFGIEYKIYIKSIEENKIIVKIKATNLDDLDVDKYIKIK